MDGADRLPSILDQLGDEPAMLRRLGCVPSYYLRYFYEHDKVVAEQRFSPKRGERVAEIEAQLLEIGLISSLRDDSDHIHAVNLRNNGHFPFLPYEAVIEVNATVGADGPTAIPTAPVGPMQSGLIAAVAAYEELALDAALRGGRDRVYRALLAHPLVGQYDLAEGLTERLPAANAAYLGWAP